MKIARRVRPVRRLISRWRFGQCLVSVWPASGGDEKLFSAQLAGSSIHLKGDDQRATWSSHRFGNGTGEDFEAFVF